MATQVTASAFATTKITQLYVAMFGRAPDFEGLNFWASGLDAGQTVAKIAQDMFATTPARAYFPSGSSSEQVIQAFYVNVLGRQPDAEGLAFWVARLDALKATGNVNAEGQVVTEIIDIVVNYQGNTPEGLESARLFANKIEVANFWVAENGSAENAGKPIALVTSNPDSVVQVKTQILSDFSVGTITLKEAVVDGALQPIRLTTEGSNAGTTATTAGDDTIVAGRLELLHQAYIDGGLGRNTLEIDAKGVYAQPAALLNIQEVRVHNLPNVYTTAGNGATGYLNNSSYPQLASNLAAASEVIPASAFNKLVVTANQLKLTVDGQSHTVPAGIYTAESLAEAINAAAGSVVAVVNAAGVSIDGAAMTFRGNAAGQISAAEFNSVVINDLQLQVVNNGVEVAPAVVPGGVYTALQLAAVINDLVGDDVATVDAASSAAATLVAEANAARADLAAAQLSLDAAEARKAAADALDEYTDARNVETTAQANAATASQAADDANANLALANVAVEAANAQAAAQTVFNAAVSAQAAATARTNAANAAETLKVTAAQTTLTAAQNQVTAAKTALDAVIEQISDSIDAASQALLTSAEGAVTQAEIAVAAAQDNFDAKSTALDALLALPAPTNAQIQAAQTALAQAQEALAQANADLTGATQARTEVALTIAKGLVDVNVDHLGLPVLQNEYAQAQGVATQAGVALVAAQAAQAATQAAGVAEVDAATAARNSASDALNAATSAAADALDAVMGTGTTAAELLAEAQAAAITAGTNLQLAQAAVTAATAAVNEAFADFQAAQAAADAANQAAARELAQAGSTDVEIAAALAHDVAQATGAVTAAQTVLAAAETALANATAGSLFGGSGSVVIRTSDTAEEIRFYGDQAFAFGLGDIAQDGTLTIPGRLSNSVIDLSRATSLDRLVITESAGTQVATAGALPVGDLTVVGVRNGAVLRLEGSFTQDVNIEYSAGMSSTEPLKLELVLGDVAQTASLNLVHNTSALHIDSLGGGANRLDSVDLGQGTLSKLIVSGNAGFYVAGDLDSSFSNDVAIIDASANTVGVSLVLSGTRTVEVLGTRGNDYFNIGAASSGSGDGTESVVIKDTTGNNTYVVNSFDATITTGDGNNVFLVEAGNKAHITAGNGANRVNVNSDGDATVTAGEGNATVLVDSAADAQVTLGSGKHEVTVFADGRAQVAIGAGDSRVAIEAGESYLTTGNGNNRVTVEALEGDAEVVGGDGNSQYTVTATEGHAHVTAGNGDNTFNLTADEGVQLITGNGANQIVVDGTEGDVTIVAGNGNSVVNVTTDTAVGVTVGNGNSSFDLTSGNGSVTLSVGAGNQTITIAAAEAATVTTGAGNHNVTIDANNIVVNGGETGNGTYDLSDAGNARADTIALTLGAGNNEAYLGAQLATISALNGNNMLSVEAMVLNATVGNGNNVVLGTTVNANLTLGDGDNQVHLRAFESPNTFWTLEDDLDTAIRINAGDGSNTINLFVQDLSQSGFDDSLFDGNASDFYLQPALIEIVAGDGGNTINIPDYPRGSGDSDALTTIRITTGAGNDAIVVGGSNITVRSGGGNDTITIIGTDDDYTATGDGALLNIDTGAGSATINLGAHNDAAFLLDGDITAKAGSTITGTDITLVVNTYADLRAANIATVNGESVVTRVILDDDSHGYTSGAEDGAGSTSNNATLVLTDKQFLAIGAENFSVDGAIFDTHARIKIIVTETTSLTALGVNNLSGNIDLQLEINDGVTLTMTAQQLHEHVASEGIALGQKDRTDKPAGKVVITGAGSITDPVTGIKTTFDPFNTKDTVREGWVGTTYVGGSLSADFLKPGAQPVGGSYAASSYFNVTVVTSFNGFVRPYDVEARQYILVDTDNVEERLLTNDQDTDVSDLYIRGTGDFTLAKGVELNLGDDFIVDFSTLQGEVKNFTIADFQDVKLIRGNSLEGYDATVHIMLRGTGDGDGGTVGATGDLNGLVSSGVNRYIVVDIADGDASVTDTDEIANIYLCDRTRDLETIGLRGNYNATLNVHQAMPGLDIELQGDGYATRTVQPKADGPFGYSNIGTINVSYTVPQTTPVDVFVNNQGVATSRPIHVEGVNVGYAKALTFTITDGDVIFDKISGNSISGNVVNDDVLEVLDFNTANDVTIVDALSLDKINTIDASDVQGSFKAELKGAEDATDTIKFISSTGPATLILDGVVADKVSSFISGATSDLTVEIKGTVDLHNANTSGIDAVTLTDESTLALTYSQLEAIGTDAVHMAAVDTTGTLEVTGWNGGVIDTGALGDGIEANLTMAAGTFTLAAGSDFSQLGALTIGDGTTLNLTADQLSAIVAGLASPVPGNLDDVLTLGQNATLNISGLTQAHLDAEYVIGTQTFTLIDLLERLSEDNTAGTIGTITLAESVNLPAGEGSALDFAFVLGAGMTLGVATAAQADGLQVTGGVGSTIEIQFLDINGQPGRDVLGADNSLDASGYNVDKVRIPEVLIGTGNVDWMFANLPERVVKSIYQLGWVDGVSQTVEIEAGTTVPGWLVINITDEQVEVRDLTVNLLGGAKLDGNLRLTTTEKLDDAGNPLFHTLLKTLTINSTGTAENALTGQTANIIDGNIAPTTAQGGGGAGYTAVENNLLNVTINAEQDLVVTGSVVFNSRVDEDLLIPNDEAAVAKLTVTGTANVTIGNLSTTDDDVDSLVVTNNGTGFLTVGIDGSATGFDAADALSFVGTGDIVLRITGAVDLTNDNLAAVSAIQLVGAATVTLTADQVEALGAANITKSGATGAGTLEVIGLDSADTFDSTLVGNGVVINVTTAAGDVVLNAAANLTDISHLHVDTGNSITLTADQALTLLVEGVTPAQSITFDGGGTVNVTNANQADFDAGLGAVLIAMNAGLEAGTLGITGDLKLTASIVNAAAVDGFALEGDVPGLRIDVTMDEANRTGDPTGAFVADADLGLAAGTDEAYNVIGINKDAGVTSRNIATYVVTALDAQATDVFYVCNATEGLTTLGLQGNGGDTIYFGGVKRDVTFLLEGDGYASWSDVEKRDQSPDASNIGALVAAFYTPNNPMAVVNINNQGVALTDGSIAGTERKLVVDGVTINNTLGLTINVADGDATITTVGGNTVKALNLVAVEDLFITNTLPNLDTIDATAVGGLFKATISDNDFDLVTGPNADITITGTILESTASIDGTAGTLNLNIGTTSDLSAGTLISVETLKIASGVSVTLSAAQVAAIGEADISGVADGSAETLNINGMTGAITINQALLGTGVVLGTVTMAAGSHTLSAGTDLTGATLVVPAGGTLTLTADQYMALADLDGIAPTGSQTAAVIHITGLTQAHIDAGFSLANVSNVNVALSDVALDPAATTVNLGSTTNLNGFGVDLSANQTLGIATSVQADGLRIAGDSTNTVVFRFDALDGDTVSGDSRIDASKYSIGTLRAMDAFFTDPSALNGEENAEFVIQGLNENVTLVVYTDPTLLGIQGYNRTVIVETGVTVPAEFVFNDTGSTRELIDLTITLQGGAEIDGDLRMPTSHAAGSGARFFDDLVINSTGAAAAAGNVIDGDITPLPETSGAQNPTSTTERENNLLKVTIAGDKALTINGDIVFNKVGDNDAATTNNNGAATLTVTSTAAVTVGALDTSDNDVTSLTVSNTGGATLSLTIDAAKIDAADALSFTGDNIALTVLGNVDLSNDMLTGLDTLTIGQAATLTLSQAQLTALGAVNLLDGGLAGSATLNLNGVNAAFDATTIAAGIDVQTLTLAGSMDFAATASNLTGVDTIVVPAGATLTLTAAQFQQLAGFGTISAAGATVNITGLTQADIDSGAFDTSLITAGTITLSLAGNVNLSADDVIENVTSVILTSGQTLGLATAAQADDLNVAGGANTTLVFQFVPMIAFPGQINAAGYNVTTLKALAAGFTFGGNSNVEYSIDDLPSAVELRLYEDPELLGFLTPTMRKVVIEAGITTPTGLVFNDWDANDVVSTLSLTLEGGVELNGNLSIPTRTDKTADTEPLYFSQLTLVSSGTQPNVIDGNISTATVLGGLNTSENNLVSVAINGTQALTINGDITFNKVGNNAVGGGDDATAVLNVNSSAAVTMGAVNTTDDDVTGLTVNNTGAGTLSLTVDAAKIDAADALSFTGDNIALTVNGNVDLSNDNLAGVNTIAISDNSTLTVTQAQFDALGAANFGTDGSPVAVNIVITEFGAAPFDATDLAAGINVQSLVLAASPAVITLDPATNLTDVDQIVVPAGSTLRLTAAQFQQLQGEGTIVSTAPSTAFNVEIYDVRQANVAVDTDNDGVVDAGDQVLNLGSIGNGAAVTLQLASDATTVTFGSFTSTGVSAPAFASDLFVGTSTNLASIQMGNSQSVVFVSAAQADGIRVTGGTSSNVVFAFDDTLVLEANTGPNSLPGNGIDASLYNVTNLRALNVFVDGRNVEQVVENLPGVVNLVVYENPEDVAVGFRSAVNRTVIIEAGVAIDDFVAFIDLNTSREIRNLTIEMQGGTEIDGNVRLATMPQASPTTQPRYFDTLTIASTGATANTIDGNITAQPSPATPSQVGSVENNLLNVVVSGTQNLVITGDIVFSKVGNGAVGGGDDAVANLTISNTGTTTISQLDVSDNDLSGLTIVNNGGLLTVTGASPAVNDINVDVLGGAGANLETLTLSGTGNIIFGLNPNSNTETGVDLGNVSTVNASALSGSLNLGEVTNIDNANFSFISGTGVTTLTLTSDTLLETAVTDLGWNFNFANAAVGSEFHLGSAAGTSLDFDNGDPATAAGSLTINLGNNTTLYIDENTNLTDLDLSILQSPTAPAIVLADGVTLTLTAAQASGLRIIAGPDTGTVGITAKVQIVDLGNTAVDLSGIAANIAGTTLLEDNDVTLDAATNLGAFSVTLNSLVDSGSMDLSGQTIRFATQVQADGRTILVTGDADNSAGVNSTNVVWLFNSVTGPLDTGDYSGQIGRLWMTQALLSGANVEQLFTTLPNTIVRSEFTTLTQLDGFLSPSQPVDRIVELVAFTNLPNGMVFNDTDALEGIQSLTLNLGGQVATGNISIDDAVALGTDPTTVLFNELTINSYRALHQDHVLAPEAYVNDNDGVNEIGEFVQPQNINTVGNIRVVGVANSGIDLLTVNLDTKAVSQNLSGPITGLNQNAGANLVVGTITFDSAAKSYTVTAELNVAGANSTTVASLDASDADIDVMVISNSGPGALTITGASPAVGLGTSAAVSNVEELAINATGNITLGTAGDANKPGVVGDDLSRIEVNGAGIVNLGVIALVDGSSVHVVTPSFLLNGSGKANTFAVFGEANVGGVPTAPVLQATGSWEFRDVTMTFTDDVVLGAGTVDFNNVALTISGNVNFTTLSELTIDETDVTIEVPAGSSLTILAEDADGLTITGDGSVTVLGLEDAVDADLSGIMTNTGDTGTVSVIVDTADGADVNALPDTVVLDAAANLGKAQVSVIGGGTLDVTNVPVLNLQATWNQDGLNTTLDITVKVVFTVAANTTLVVTAAQGDERTVTGAGTTNVEDIGLFAGANDLSLAAVTTTTVNIAVDTSVTLNSADNLGAAGPGRVTTIAASTTLTAAGSVVSGQYITSNQATAAGTNGTLIVDDENSLPVETPITADLRNVSVEFIELAPTALAGTIQFPVLYGDPVAKYGDAAAIPVVLPNPNVAVQTVTLTAVQASGQTIVGANGGTRGEVVVNDLDGAFTNLSNINAGVMTAHVDDTPVTLNAGTDLGAFDVVIDAVAGQLTLTAAQADGIQITDGNVTADAVVTVSALAATPNADLSKIAVFDEFALLDANGGVSLGANLGSNMEVIVSDSLVGGPNTVTFTGTMVSAATTFTIASDAITLVFDANAAHQLTVAEAVEGVPVDQLNSTVIVNNVDGDLMNLTGITADTLIANVPADAVMNAGTDFGNFKVVLAEGADLTLTFTQFLNVGADGVLTGDNIATPLVNESDFSSAAGGVEELITVTNWTPASGALDTSVLPSTLALVLQVDASTPNVTVHPGTNLSGVEEIVIPAGVTLTMTADQFQQIQHSTTVVGAGTLNITNLDSDNADIDLSSVTAVAGTISLESDVNTAAGVATKFVLSAPLVAGDTISVEIDGVTYTEAFDTSHGQTLANFKALINASGDFAAIVEGNTVTVRPKDPTVGYTIDTAFARTGAGTAVATTVESVYVVLDAAAVLDNQAGSKFSIVYTANNQSLTLASEVQADGRTVTDGANTGTVLVLGFTDADDVVDNNAVITASGFDVGNVWVLNDYLFKEFGINSVPANFEFFLGGLAGSIPVTVYDTDTLLQANLLNPGSLIPIDRVVTVDQETTVQASVAFNVLSTTAEVRNLTLNLEGNSVIVGNLQLPQDKDPNADLNNANPANDSLPLFFNTLTINSTNETGLPTAANRITGAIFADNGSDGAGSESLAETFTLTLNPAMSITGNEGLIAFDGRVLALQNGWTDADVAAALAGLSYNNWTATDNSTAESTTFTLSALTAGQTVTIAGRTVTAVGAVTAAQVATAFASGTSVPLVLTVSGTLATPTGWTGTPVITATATAVTFTNTVNGDATNFTTSTGTNPAVGAATNGTAVVEFLNKNAGVVTNVTAANFTFAANNGSTTGLTGTVATTQEGTFVASENNLYNVVINADHDLVIAGELELSYVTRSDALKSETVTGTITVNGDADVTIGSVNSDDIHVTGVTLTHTGAGTVSAPGTSPGAAVSNTEVLTINANNALGTITLGTAGDATKPGVSGADLSLIDVNGEGTVNLGVIALVDTAAPVAPAINSFFLDATGSAGDVTATIGADLAAGGVWSFENGADGTLNLTINEDAVFTQGGTLSIQGATITIDGDIDLSGVDLSGVQNDCEFFVPAGSVLTLSVEQALEFAADNIPATGSGTIKIVGDATDADSAALGAMLQTVTVDLSGVTLTLAGADADADGVLEFQNATATNDLGAPAAQNLIGSANDDLFLLSNNNDTVTGGLGDDTYTGGAGYYTYNVDAGTDTITSLYSDVGGNDVLVVTAGATAIAAGITEFVATAATVNNGTANLSTDAAGGEINVSAAGGTGRFYLNGGADVDVLVGGAGSDVINGGLNGTDHDVLTGGLGADYFVFNIVQNNPTTPTVSTTTQGVDREQITFTKPDAVDDATSLTIAYRINGSLTTPGTVVDITAVNSGDVTAVAAAVGIHLAGVFGSNATVSVNAGVVTLQGANGVAIEIVSVTPNAGTLVGAPAEAVVLDTPQTTQLTIPAGTAVGGDYVVGDILSFTFTFAEGTGGTVNYTVNTGVGHGVTQAQVTAGVAAAINANWDLQLDTSVGGNVISVTSTLAGADFGGFSVTAGAVGGVSATGASDLNPATDASVDRIMDFVSGTDKIVLSVAGTVANFESGLVQEASFAAAKAAAETAFTDPGVRYFFTAVNDINADTNADGVLFFDLNGDAVVDGAIALIGVTSMAAGDIVTTVV